ncbi:hypothetical protein QJS66_12450 [Kocuria rhizophila]|nr:hypothetical protein QJS66_12450 [Kocuria rhizophila]
MKAGLRARPLGDEAILDTDTLARRRCAGQARCGPCAGRLRVTVAQRAGRHHHAADRRALRAVGAGTRWTAASSMALNRLADRTDGRSVAVWLGRLRASGPAVLRPWRALDLIRRFPKAPNGVNEAMVATLAEEGGGPRARGLPQLGPLRVSRHAAGWEPAWACDSRTGCSPGETVSGGSVPLKANTCPAGTPASSATTPPRTSRASGSRPAARRASSGPLHRVARRRAPGGAGRALRATRGPLQDRELLAAAGAPPHGAAAGRRQAGRAGAAGVEPCRGHAPARCPWNGRGSRRGGRPRSRPSRWEGACASCTTRRRRLRRDGARRAGAAGGVWRTPP